jgi:hypothetical protein
MIGRTRQNRTHILNNCTTPEVRELALRVNQLVKSYSNMHAGSGITLHLLYFLFADIHTASGKDMNNMERIGAFEDLRNF